MLVNPTVFAYKLTKQANVTYSRTTVSFSNNKHRDLFFCYLFGLDGILDREEGIPEMNEWQLMVMTPGILHRGNLQDIRQRRNC